MLYVALGKFIFHLVNVKPTFIIIKNPYFSILDQLVTRHLLGWFAVNREFGNGVFTPIGLTASGGMLWRHCVLLNDSLQFCYHT